MRDGTAAHTFSVKPVSPCGTALPKASMRHAHTEEKRRFPQGIRDRKAAEDLARYDLLVKNGTLVQPWTGEIRADLAVRDGVVAAIGDDLPASDAGEVLDARGKMVFPGAVDAHFHLGIYRQLGVD